MTAIDTAAALIVRSDALVAAGRFDEARAALVEAELELDAIVPERTTDARRALSRQAIDLAATLPAPKLRKTLRCYCPGDCGCRAPEFLHRPVHCGCRQH